jgi:mannose-1-phosphate guanylyltransferase
LFTVNVNALLKRYDPKDLFVSTKKRYVEIAKNQAPDVPEENYIIEPDFQNGRGPGEGLAFLYLQMKHPNEPFMLVQTDDIRLPVENYLRMIEVMEETVKETDQMITGGITPKYPILGVDYLRLGELKKKKDDVEIYEIKEFVWRLKDYYKTKELVDKNHVVTHCNHLCWYPDSIIGAYKRNKPEWYQPLMEIKKIFEKGGGFDDIGEIYESMPRGPTEDVTIHEMKSGHAAVLNFNWVDIGTWDSVYENFSHEENVYADGNVIALDSKSSLIKSDNPDKLLIVPKDKVDKIKDIQNELKNKKLDKYL